MATEDVRRGWDRTFARLRPFAEPVVISDPPTQKGKVPYCLSKHVEDIRPCLSPRVEALRGPGREGLLQAVEAAKVPHVDLSRLMCLADECPVVVGDVLIWQDQHHVTGTFATWFAPVLVAHLDAAWGARGEGDAAP